MKSNKTILYIIIALVIIGGGYAVLNDKKTGDSNTIKIGVMASFSGETAVFGESIKNATTLAIDEINASVGINGKRIEPIYEDSKCNNKEATIAAQKLVSIDKTKFIIGLVCSGEVISSIPITEKEKVIVMAQGSSPQITSMADYVFRTWPSDAESGKLLAETIIKKYKKTALITELTDYTTAIENVFKNRYIELGGTIIAQERFVSGTTDFKSLLVKIKENNPDAIVFNPQSGPTAARIVKQIRDAGMKQQLYGAFLSGEEFTGSGSATEGAIMVDTPVFDPKNTKANDFMLVYKSKYNSEPPYPFAAGGAYDQIYLLAEAIGKVGTNTDKVKDYLYGIKNYDGVLGSYHFDSNGDVVGLNLQLKQIKGGKIVDYKE